MSQTPVAPKRMGRPPEHGPVVAVDIDGEVLMWCQGALTGPARLRALATVAGLTGEKVPLLMRGTPVTAALHDDEAPSTEQEWLSVAACLVGASPGRARLIEAPESVWGFLETQGSGCAEESSDEVGQVPVAETLVVEEVD